MTKQLLFSLVFFSSFVFSHDKSEEKKVSSSRVQNEPCRLVANLESDPGPHKEFSPFFAYEQIGTDLARDSTLEVKDAVVAPVGIMESGFSIEEMKDFPFSELFAHGIRTGLYDHPAYHSKSSDHSVKVGHIAFANGSIGVGAKVELEGLALGDRGLPILRAYVNKNETNLETLQIAATELANINSKDVMPIIRDILKKRSETGKTPFLPATLYAAARQGIDGYRLLIDYSKAPGIEERVAAAYGASGAPSEVALPLLRQLSVDKDATVRGAAAESAGYFGQEGLEIVNQVWKRDGSLDAARGAAKIGKPALSILEETVRNPDYSFPKYTLAKCLENMEDESALKLLKASLGNENSYVLRRQFEIALYLWKKGDSIKGIGNTGILMIQKYLADRKPGKYLSEMGHQMIESIRL